MCPFYHHEFAICHHFAWFCQKSFLIAFCCEESLIWGCLIVCPIEQIQCLESCIQPTIGSLNHTDGSAQPVISCPKQTQVGHQLFCEMTPAHDDSQMLILLCAFTYFFRALAQCSDTQGVLGMVSDSIQAPRSPGWHGWCACRLGLDPMKQTWRTPQYVFYLICLLTFWTSLFLGHHVQQLLSKDHFTPLTPSNFYIYRISACHVVSTGSRLFYTNSSDVRWHRPQEVV